MRKASLGVVSLISILFSALIFSSSAYAEVTTLTVSNSGETISFDKIKPSGSGTVTKATDSLSVNTNCTEGIDLYMSAQNGSSTGTSLINNTVSNNGGNGGNSGNNNNGEITTLSGTTIGDSSTAKALSNNTWGFNTVDDNTYYGLPTYANALSHAVYSGTDSSIPIYYGAKVTSSMATGKYSGSVLYTVLVNMNCNNYTVEYDINTPEGAEGSIVSSTPPDDTILTYAKKSKLAENTFEITGYNFLGWSLDPTATTPEYDANTTEYYGSDIALAASANPGSTITMYAVWEEKVVYMQDWVYGPEFGCGHLSTGEIATLTDSRDNHKYKVKKLPDGNCWMIQNLTLGSEGGVELTSDDTNMPEGSTSTGTTPDASGKYYLPSAGYQGAINNSATKTSQTTVEFNTSNDNQAKVAYRAKGATDNSTGEPIPEDTSYYNYYTATLGYSYNGDSIYFGSSPRDICPKGWRLPKVSDNGSSIVAKSSEFANLARAYNNSASWSGSSTATYEYYTYDSTIRQNMAYGESGALDPTLDTNSAAGFTYGGYYNGAELIEVGKIWAYLSSSISATNSGLGLFINGASPSQVLPQTNLPKNWGGAVRCVAQSNAAGYMQDFDTTKLTNEMNTTYLVDKRDGKTYTVKKLPDGKVWMINNLTISATDMVADALDNTNTNIPASDSKSYYLPPRNTRYASSGNLNNPAVKSASSSIYFNGSYTNYLQIGYKTKGSTDNDSGNPVPEDTSYYDFYTATLGYSYRGDGKTSGSSPQDICPKGWRLPKVSDSGTTIIAASSEFANLARSYNSNAYWRYSGADYNTYDNAIANGIVSAVPSYNNSYAGFTRTGHYSNSASLYEVGSYGFYWSSSIYDGYNGYRLTIYPGSYIYPQTYDSKNYGCAIRCIAKESYTINYDANGGTGTMNPTRAYIDEESSLSKNSFEKNGYRFAGWSIDPNTSSSDYPDEALVTNLTTSSNSITLYAVWVPNSNIIQNYNCGNLQANSTTRLIDIRDGKVYRVKKLQDGKCWMIDNLALGHDAIIELNSNNTNLPTGTTYYLPANGYMNSPSTSTNDGRQIVSFGSSSDYNQYFKVSVRNYGDTGDSDSSGALSQRTGYYDFYTATMGYSYYSYSDSGSSSNDICPAGWRLPKTTDSGQTITTSGIENDFTYLAVSYGSDGWSSSPTGSSGYAFSNSGSSTATHIGMVDGNPEDINNSYAGFNYTGYYYNSQLTGVGSYGYYWTSSVYALGDSYALDARPSRILPQYDQPKQRGFAVRCVAKD